MEAEVPPPSSPRSDREGWELVDRPTDGAEPRPRAASPEGPADLHDELLDGAKSPASESLADDLLREPFQAGGPLQLQLPVPPTPGGPTVEEPATPTAASGSHAVGVGGSCADLATHQQHQQRAAHNVVAAAAAAAAFAAVAGSGGAGGSGGGANWAFDRHRERMRAASRLSGEGALEGFQDPQDLLPPDAAAAGTYGSYGGSEGGSATASAGDGDGDRDGEGGGAGGPVVTLGWDSLVAGVWGDVCRELEDVRALVATTAGALWERVQDGRMAVEEWAAAVRATAQQAAKSVGRTGCPLWALIGMSGLAAVALAALATQLVVNRKLSSQLRQRDRDLARLVVKILNLQDALQSAARNVTPLLRHAAAVEQRFTTTTTLIGMV